MYPKIPDEFGTALSAVAKALELNPGYLDRPDCPYSPALKGALRALRGSGGQVEPIFNENVADVDVIERELKELLTKMKSFGEKLDGLDANEKIQYFKASTGLWEKLIGMQERTLNLKKLSEFQTRVIEIMSDLMDVDQREEMMKRLENVVS
jgi:hypothetical protein